MTTTERHTLRTVHDAISRRVDFDCNGTLRGSRSFAGYGYGRMPAEFQTKLALDYDAPDFYGVLSYATPVAWFADGKWNVPPVKYSPTTSRHMAAIRRGIANV